MLAEERLIQLRLDCDRFAREELNQIPDGWQTDVYNAYSGITPGTEEMQRYCMKACKAPGKTTAEATIGLHFLSLYPFCKIAVTAITGDNLRDNLWAEFKKWMRQSDWISANFTWTKERIYNNDYPEEWWISARKWSKDADPEQQANTLAGLHADYLLFILDEAGGIPDAVAAAAEGGLATGKVVKLLIGGNPTHASGPLYRACTSERDLWWVKEITGDPDDPNRAPRVSLKWAREQIKKYGRKSPYVMVNVLGKFPSGATDSVLSMEWMEDAFNRYTRFDERNPHRPSLRPKILGVDVARFGTDITCVVVREGNRATQVFEWQGRDTRYSARRIRDIFHEVDADEIRVDDIGVGGGVTDSLKEMKLPVLPIDVGLAPIDNDAGHVNLRSELYKDLQDEFAEERIQLAPEFREETSLMQEGTTLKVEYNDRNKRRIEPKANYRKRTGRSPNYLDSLMLAWANRAAKKSTATHGEEKTMNRGNLNPWAQAQKGRPRRRRLMDRRGRRHYDEVVRSGHIG